MDTLQQIKLRELVINSLLPIGGKQRGEHIWLTCPWHSESKPSLSVHIGHKIIPGSFNCFGCKAKGNWNDLAKAFNLPFFEFKNSFKTRDTIIDHHFSECGEYKEDEHIPIASVIEDFRKRTELLNADFKHLKGIEDLPNDFVWRGFNKNFYERLGGKFYWNRELDRDYLYFPLTMNNIYTGYTLCNLDGKDENKYQLHTNSSKVFFLYDYIPQNVPIVLVEGHFDAIRLYAEGFFPLAIFGVQNWSNIKMNYLIAKAPPKIIIAFDGDNAGYEASVKVFLDLRIGCNVDIFYLPIFEKQMKLDPGNMPNEFLIKLREKIDE